MRGGSQAHLIETDNRQYVVKFRNNPQHRRILVNEWIAAGIFSSIGISTPSISKVVVQEDFLTQTPEVYISLGFKRIIPDTGIHFGSQYVSTENAVHDFLPDDLLPKVVNPEDFLASLVVDKWIGNTDMRQAVFLREDCSYRACMIDHGFAFNGPHWNFVDNPIWGVYFRPQVYHSVKSMDDFFPWLDQVKNFPETDLLRIFKNVPKEWISGDEEELARLLEKLLRRRDRVQGMIDRCLSMFPSMK